MSRKINKELPYAEVIGLPGAVFEQNGVYFDSDGIEVGAEKEPLKDEFSEMNRDDLLKFLVEHGETQYNPNGPDEDLRAVCREVKA